MIYIQKSKIKNILSLAFAITTVLYFTYLLIKTAWLCDDAYISYRVVDNFVNGYGLRWNISERVQAYTHPLWLFWNIIAYSLTHERFLTWHFANILISIIVVTYLIFGTGLKITSAIIAIIVASFSRAFVDFSTSGLENPLSHLLLLLFVGYFFRVVDKGEVRNRDVLILSLISCLGGLNRIDCLLFYFPMLFYIWYLSGFCFKAIFYICVGYLPLVGWEIFSIVYYGFPFPNTAYAKLSAGIPKIEFIKQGLWYYLYSIHKDLITLVVIALGILVSVLNLKKQYRKNVFPMLTLSAGVVLYCLYILWIGGCFMGGRFFTLPFLLSIVIIMRFFDTYNLYLKKIFIALLLIMISISQPELPLFTGSNYGSNLKNFKLTHGVGNEREFYFQGTALQNYGRIGKRMPCYSWAERGWKLREENKNSKKTYVYGAIGATGFLAGPNAHIIDYFGLAEPLLARLPCTGKWRIGHFRKEVPKGYEETINTGINMIQDKDLAEYYEKLHLLISGPIFSIERLKTIIQFNLGCFDYLIKKPHKQPQNIN